MVSSFFFVVVFALFFSIEQNFGLNIQIALTTVFPILSSKSVFSSLCCLPHRQVGMPVPLSHRNPTWVPLNFKMKSGIHIPSHPVHPDNYNLVRMIKITSKVALRMSEVLLPTTESFQNFLYDFIHFPCVFPKVATLLTKSELSFSLEVVSAVSGSVVMVLQITSLTFSSTSAPSTSLSWNTNHRRQN